MSFFRKIKRIAKKVTRATITRPAKFVYRQGRKDLRTTVKFSSKAAPYITAVAAAGASYFGGPVAGAAVGAIGSEASYRLRKEYGREVGESYKTRSQKARSVRRRAAVAAGIGLGVGAVASGITTAALGGTFAQSAGSAALGQGGSQLLGSAAGPGLYTSTPYSSTSFSLASFGASAPSAAFPQGGLVTSLASVEAAASPATAASAAAASSGPGIWTTLATAGVTGAASGAARSLGGQVKNGTAGQPSPFDSFLAGVEMAALQAAGMGGGGSGGQTGALGDPNIQNTGGGGTDWGNLLLIAAATFAGAKLLKVI